MSRDANFNDWQDLKINKDIEKISRKIDSQRAFNIIVTIQLSVSLLTLISSLFETPLWLSITLTAIATILFASVLIVSVKDFIVKKSFSLWKKRKTIGFIDDFDNRISKNVMTSYELLKSLLSSDEKRPEILMLQTQEAYYYLTKSIRMIFDAREYLEYSIMNCDPNECFKNRKIHMGRFKLIIKSITNLHDEIYKYASDKFENETDNYGTCNMHDVNATLLAQINDRLELMPKNDNSNE